MGKGDFICTEHGVIEKPFISISTFRKYKCPECGILCKKCVKSSLWVTKCKHCGSADSNLG